ncbi:MAG TPA: threonine--tRNA ligase, partial [Lachnospiraceae bacterium]|nr:threonine--tRNA ligase [Lachnospiraceae bacterium]
GALNGLTRVRGFTQDDAHIICAPEQMLDEVISALKFSLYILRSFGLHDYKVYVATKPKSKSIGSKEDWEHAISVLKDALQQVGLPFDIDEGGGAFYGPKIDVKLKDALNREWQCSTVQFDFNLPQRFDMYYIGPDGQKHVPCMIHRALFGSVERFIALLIEHYQGDFPLWLAPVQFAIVPIGEKHNDYCKKLEKTFKKQLLRVTANYEDLHMREKIKRFEMEKIPFILIVGDKDIAADGFSVRSRQSGNLGFMTFEQLCGHIEPELEKGRPQYLL